MNWKSSKGSRSLHGIRIQSADIHSLDWQFRNSSLVPILTNLTLEELVSRHCFSNETPVESTHSWHSGSILITVPWLIDRKILGGNIKGESRWALACSALANVVAVDLSTGPPSLTEAIQFLMHHIAGEDEVNHICSIIFFVVKESTIHVGAVRELLR